MTHADLMNAPVTGAFEKWPKMPRLLKDMTVTEKIDGTNACVLIIPDYSSSGIAVVDWLGDGVTYTLHAQSRTRMITPVSDNYGFAAWVVAHAEELVRVLGPGRHYGEWWGQGIQRRYDREGRTFSLFNTAKWTDDFFTAMGADEFGLSVVPTLYTGPFDTEAVAEQMDGLRVLGSRAAPGFMDPEGVAVFHHASRTVYKTTFEHDMPKGGPRDADENVINLFEPVIGSKVIYQAAMAA